MTYGIFLGAENCDLIVLYALSNFKHFYKNYFIKIYRHRKQEKKARKTEIEYDRNFKVLKQR